MYRGQSRGISTTKKYSLYNLQFIETKEDELARLKSIGSIIPHL